MATFFMFGKYGPDAFRGMSAKRTEEAGKLISKFGGEIREMYALLGEQDLVLILTFPAIEQAMKAAIALSKSTGVAFTTAPAVTVEEFDKMLEEV